MLIKVKHTLEISARWFNPGYIEFKTIINRP